MCVTLEFFPDDPRVHLLWKDGAERAPRGQIQYGGARAFWGCRSWPGVWAGDDGQAQSRPRAASLHGLAFSLEDAIASGFPQARYFSFSPVETEPAPLGEQDRDSLHSPDFPKGQSLCVFASSFSLRALKISWLFSQPLSPSTHGEHSLLTVLCSRSLLSLSQSSEGCSATVLL